MQDFVALCHLKMIGSQKSEPPGVVVVVINDD